MQISARNNWTARVEAVDKGPVTTEVGLRLDSGEPMVSTITTGSAEALGLSIGSEVRVLVKASNVLVLAGSVDNIAASARNRFDGTIIDLEHGVVTTIVRLRSVAGTEVTASITKVSAERLGLNRGMATTALIKASDVLLMIE